MAEQLPRRRDETRRDETGGRASVRACMCACVRALAGRRLGCSCGVIFTPRALGGWMGWRHGIAGAQPQSVWRTLLRVELFRLFSAGSCRRAWLAASLRACEPARLQTCPPATTTTSGTAAWSWSGSLQDRQDRPGQGKPGQASTSTSNQAMSTACSSLELTSAVAYCNTVITKRRGAHAGHRSSTRAYCIRPRCVPGLARPAACPVLPWPRLAPRLSSPLPPLLFLFHFLFLLLSLSLSRPLSLSLSPSVPRLVVVGPQPASQPARTCAVGSMD